MLRCRDFIQRALYQPGRGYFMQHPVILTPQASKETQTAVATAADENDENAPLLRYDDILAKREFEAKVQQLYNKQHKDTPLQGNWLTPVELFAPWYSYAIAESILEKHDGTQPLRIYEIGAGNGTNAFHICNYIRQYRPRLYEKLQYTTVEISPFLVSKQRQKLQQKHEKVHEVIHADAQCLDQAIERTNEASCFVLALEVFDNFPHDKGTSCYL